MQWLTCFIIYNELTSEIRMVWWYVMKQNLNSDGQQFHQYQPSEQPPLTNY